MENDKIKEVIDFAEKIKNACQFNVFWERPRREGFGVQLNFSGYNDLMLTVRDIMKVCVAALGEEDTASNLTISSVLEIALQLMPMEETMILDECYALHKKLKQPKLE
ncbi:hypothetical protein ACLI1A_08270 [Flavobacterium sp. RHBU_3]|uniref:hypothetical protein n=1 Tax=Flavobacterium sp. RHBU_3 TaxID=3391184 RepID=UPI0039854DAD